MSESERVQRLVENHYNEDRDILDDELAKRILSLLNDARVDKYCMVDAYYYDFSVIPEAVQKRLNLYRDVYLIFGITTEGEIISKWVDRWDLDSSDPIADGEVMHEENFRTNIVPPEIAQMINAKLLLIPIADFMNLFGKLE